MKLKAKLISTIAAFCLVLGFVITGVWAAGTGVVNIGGSVGFVAEDVYATITGEITGTAIGDDVELKTLNYSAAGEPSADDLNTWKNKTLNFADKNSVIKYTITVENLSDERMLYAELVGSVGTSNNIIKALKNDGETYVSDSIVEIPSNKGDDTNKTVFTIEMSVDKKDISAPNVNFSYDLYLYDHYVETDKLSFTYDPETLTASVKMINTTVTKGNVIIPETVKGTDGKTYTVTTIPDAAFKGCSNMTGISVPDTITFFGNQAISGTGITEYNLKDNGYYLGNADNPYVVLFKLVSKTLTSMTIEEGCRFIYGGTFYNNSVLGSITLPSTLKGIGIQAFAKNTALENIEIPYGVEILADGVFSQCTNLESIELPDTVKSIGTRVFYGCTKLQNAVLSKSLTEIPQSTFYECTNLGHVNIPDGITKIDKMAFVRCGNLTIDQFPEGLTYIGQAAFDSTKIDVQLPSTLREIHDIAFQYCPLTNITLPESLEYIGDYAFGHCDKVNLKTVVIPAGIKQIGGTSYDPENPSTTVIGSHVFYNFATNNVEEYVIDSSNPYYMTVDGVLYRKSNGVPTVIVAYPSGNKADTWIMPDTVQNTYIYALSRAFYLREIVLSDSYDLAGENSNLLGYLLYVYHGVTKITCKPTNTKYNSTETGQVYSEDGSILYFSPILSGLSSSDTTKARLNIAEGTTRIYVGAFYAKIYNYGNAQAGNNLDSANHLKNYDEIYIPASVLTIDEGAIYHLNQQCGWTIIIDENNPNYMVNESNQIVAKA